MIYFDNSATTKILPEVLETYVQTSQRIYGNASSLHTQGEVAQRILSQARKQVAELLEVSSEEIYFTSGGTEANNWVVKGTAIEKRHFGHHVIVSAIEHPSVIESARQLEQLGFEVSFAPVDENGFIIVSELLSLIRKDTVLISTMAVNNEIGTIQPIELLSKELEKYPNIHFHVDAVQAIGKVPLHSWLTNRVDFISLSAHKFHGPKGVGILYWKKGKKLASLLSGGGQEKGQRSGTENIAGIIATSKALRLSLINSEEKQKKIKKIRDYLIEKLSQYEKVFLFTQDTDRYAPQILCFGIKEVKGEVLVHALEEKEIIISTTSACSSKKKMIGGTLLSMDVPKAKAQTAVRVSLDSFNTLEEAEQFLSVFHQLYQKFEKING